ncbi:metalloregulator ArsR/SmtB family transcription factor [Leifsonia sp. H3M29-4]|uniref:metalloregulator ArsR/SmtB family transcription factor n=1 Tax=Salinibacterium metalliresistens TaxID=3031321 RepID=UPI0023D9ED32|nr:metalloregulator ArsR/SmtB family transcription factor [Salinibacterium metalliresistens]MDF1478260.1 metalloregulator ArsR/SmtB family transcription factor [Salinibacterium metalliresistens]
MLPDPIDRDEAEQIARNLKAMADPTRIQLLGLIQQAPDGRATVTELAERLGLAQPTATHHLKVLADEGLLDRTQEGRQVWHSIAPERAGDVAESVRADPAAGVVAGPVLERIAADLAVRFAGVFSPETVTGVVDESYRLLAEQARITRYLPSLTSRFAAERLAALARAKTAPEGPPSVLFVCVQNAGRSQLASAILRSLGGDDVRVLTAGSQPAGAIDPRVIAALDEIGVSIDGEFPKPLTDEVVRAADVVVTMGCGDACPVYPGRRYLDWELPDPATLTMDGVREVRDDIDRRVRQLLTELDSQKA